MNFLEIIGAVSVVSTIISGGYMLLLVMSDEKKLEMSRAEKRQVYNDEHMGPYYVKMEVDGSEDVIIKIEKETVDIFGRKSLYGDTGFLQYVLKKFEIEHGYRETIKSITLDFGLVVYFDLESGVINNCRMLELNSVILMEG